MCWLINAKPFIDVNRMEWFASLLLSCPGAEPGNKTTPAPEPENWAVYGYAIVGVSGQ